MIETYKFAIGIVVLILGFPLGSLLARMTKEELPSGQKWFKGIIFISLIGSITSLIIKNDMLLFSFLFVAIVTSRSILLKKGK